MLLQQILEDTATTVCVKMKQPDMYVEQMLGQQMKKMGGKMVPGSQYEWKFETNAKAKEGLEWAQAFMNDPDFGKVKVSLK